MSFARPELLQLLWAIPVLAGLLVLAWRSRKRGLQALGPLMSARISARASRVHVVRALLWTVAFACFVVALAQPRWGFRWQELRQEGLSLVVVLDVSRSMDVQDVSPSRLERARREVRDLAGMLAGDRVGLVLSAGGAYAQMPLTLDYEVLDALARQASTDTLRAQGSDLGAAIDKAMELLAGDDQGADRAILIISDGEDQIGGAVAAAERAAAAGVHIYTVGVGTPDGAPIPMAEGGFKNDRGGQVVISRLDEDALRQLAEVGQGAYVRSVAGDSDMKAIYIDQIRGQLTTAEQGVRRDKIWTERHPIFLAAGLLLIIASLLLRPGPLRLHSAVVALALAMISNPARADDLSDLLQQQAEDP
ncbi:MAG: Ca-activated chloride channel family protein, partial [Myxococcota bacterium]